MVRSLLCIVILLSPPLWGDDIGKPPGSRLRIDTAVVQIPVAVTDRLDRPVTGLTKEDFRVIEDGAEQKVLSVVREDAPVAVAVVFDASYSMQKKLPNAREAVSRFLESANPEDEFLLVVFHDQPRLAHGLTRDIADLQSSLGTIASEGHTALLDAIYLAMQEIKKSKQPRKALLILSDGGDNNSRYSEREIRRIVREEDVLIYALGIFDGPRFAPGLADLFGSTLLNAIASETGGRYFPVEGKAKLPEAAQKAGEELRSQYVVSYAPGNRERDGKYRHVQVKLANPGKLRVTWRMGYYAPAN